VASAWGSSWGTSWADSWGATVAATTTVGTVGGGYSKREIDRVFKEYLTKKERKRRRAEELQPAAASIAALVEANAQSDTLSDVAARLSVPAQQSDDEDAIMVLLLAA
jgi:hypothetical protein